MRSSGAPLALHADVYRYWDERRAGRAMPARADMRPEGMRAALPHLLLLDIVDGRFHYRLVGTKVVQDVGKDMTGTFAGGNVRPPAYGAAIIALYERVRSTGRPQFAEAEYETPAGVIQLLSRLLLPLGADGCTVDMLLISRIARHPKQDPMPYGWLGKASGRITSIVEIGSLAEVEAATASWARGFGPEEPR